MSSEIFKHSMTLGGASNRLKTIITTLGAKGVIVCMSFKDDYQYFPPIELDSALIKSAVGSGDSFLGGFIYALLKNWSFDKSIEAG